MEKNEINRPAEFSDDKNRQEVKQEIIQSLDIIKRTDIFDPEFLNEIVFIVFGERKIYKYYKQSVTEVSKEEFSVMDFMQGKRRDFIGINPKKEFERQDLSDLNDFQFLPYMFFEGKLTYNEFAAHEIAHNLFDMRYVQNIGEYEEKDGITDVSEEYRSKIKATVVPLIGSNFSTIETEKFSFSRQQIAEIFAMLYEREFCRRSNENIGLHDQIRDKVRKFANDPQKELFEFNDKNGRNCLMDDFYKENHILSLIAAPLLEEKYSNWEKRNRFFWQ